MEIARTQEAEQGFRVQSRFIIPPKGGTCFINRLSPELLSRILEFGSIDYYAGDGEDMDDFMSRYWNNICNRQPDAEEDPDSDVETEEEREHVHVLEGHEEEVDVDSDSDPTSGSSLCLYQFRVVVSLVCRHWRNVAISTPPLWTNIEVRPDILPPYDLVSKLLKRSQNLPLDIMLNCNYPKCKPSIDDIRFLFAMFIPHIPRWRLMMVLVSEYHYMYEFLSAVSDPSVPPASRLTTFEIDHLEHTRHLDSFPYPSMSKHLTLFGGLAPLLTKLTLTGGHVDWDQPWIASASNLTFLELAYHAEDVRPSWAQFATILRGARSLEGLDLCFSGPSGDPQEWLIEPTPGSSADLNAPIQLLRVTRFDLAYDSQTYAIGLLRKFYLPALKKLCLSLHDGDYTGDYTEFAHELAGPATSLFPNEEQPHSLLSRLETLKLELFDCSTESIETLCGELQNLKSLELWSLTISQTFCKILCTPCTSTGRSDVWLPRLDELHVSYISVDVLRGVVQSRKEAGVPLRMLRAKNLYGLNNENEKWFKENAETFKPIWEHADDVGEESDEEDDDEGSDVD
ncbi:hypothetical protein EV363DRAFT_50732 [Boletus edulis]|uniref:F-box domain-containing protein n=1 Tax=Boletus edulis BED1 TaxID=1328754 RepID=A0AAD4BFE9_BOLED|nr:hypothetical protein EV363DRAFT_50732 [Boletus edulis]KAF8424447.1 hypothetical protein L210DRAFT_3653458 [Boletus edulis BED1]KAF8432732.1 hypothetical protein L210DRAFT_2766618 [Boletus edulis BED1]